MKQAVAAVEQIAAIDRAGCRARAVGRFAADRMVEDHLAVHDELIPA